MKKILFIAHDATVSGAPLILYNIIKYLKENTTIEPVILLRKGGELADDFIKLGKTYFWQSPEIDQSFINIFKNRVKRRLKAYKSHHEILLEQLCQEKISLIYSNTVVNGTIVEIIKHRIKKPLITHIHELETAIANYESEGAKKGIQLSDKIIAVSDAVRKNLIKNHGISENKISVFHAFAVNTQVTNMSVEAVKKEIGLPEKSFVVIGSGTPQWCKGVDLFIQIALKTNLKHKIYFVWLGGNKDSLDYKRLNYDIENIGLQDVIKLVPFRKKPENYYNMADIFVMSSREDSFPIVNLEAGMLSKPIICFQDSGGTPELVENDCGFIVPYLDIDTFSEKIIYLYKNQQELNIMGNNLFNKVNQHNKKENIIPQIIELIKQNI